MALATAVGLRQAREKVPRDSAGGARPSGQPGEVDLAPGKAICCRFCLWRITSAVERSTHSGAHLHTFANPHGIVFEIGCFRRAPGCRVHGPAQTEFSWFRGHTWRLALCNHCLAHLGWRFQGPGDFFFGLILNHLTEIDS